MTDEAKLTTKQAKAIPLLLAAKTYEEGCKSAQVSKATFYSWMQDETFAAEFDRQRTEIVDAVKELSRQVASGRLLPENIDEQSLNKALYTANLPDPDLLIRTSGEMRLSNFLLWQVAYTEIYITNVLWPDFRKKDLFEAVAAFQKRERRFGKVQKSRV